ncbi:MAG TPA: hypothetical protein P5541_08610 [Thermovirgaceae bacterium]|nr:hypothetical protein [Thermovirgaceae bacterium]
MIEISRRLLMDEGSGRRLRRFEDVFWKIRQITDMILDNSNLS